MDRISIKYFMAVMLLASCSGSKMATSTLDSSDFFNAKKVIVDPSYDSNTDAFEVISAEVEGTYLKISVSYDGGCEDHVFELFTDGQLIKGLPPQQRFFLKHYAHKDACDSLVEDELVFDLEGTTTAGNSLHLLLNQFDKELIMDF